MGQENRLQKSFEQLFKKFHPEELEKVYVSLFGPDMWNNVIKVCKIKGRATRTHISKATALAVKDFEPNYLRKKLKDLQLLDTSQHSSRRKWFAFQLCGVTSNVVLTERGIKREFISTINKMDMQSEVVVKMHEEIIWISIFRTTQPNNVVYLAYFGGESVIFASRRNFNLKMSQLISTALKFESLKKLSLDGKDIRSLFKMIKQKEGKAVEVTRMQSRNSDQVQNNQSKGVDYTRWRVRKAAMENCLGSNPPVLQSLTVKTDCGLRVKKWLPEMEGFPAQFTLQFKHENVAELLMKLAEKSIIAEPIPHYLKSFPTSGRNTIMLRDASSNRTVHK